MPAAQDAKMLESVGEEGQGQEHEREPPDRQPQPDHDLVASSSSQPSRLFLAVSSSSSRPSPSHCQSRGDYGLRWGEGAARCFSMESDLDEDESVRLMPIPECFICPMSQTPMEDPVMTVDGCVYERSYIEQWIRHRQQQKLRVTSPATNQELPSHRLVSLSALQKAIEAYLAHRPELKGSLTASRSFEEAAQMLQNDLLEKQAAHVSAEDELSLLRDSNEVLFQALNDAERTGSSLRWELEQAKTRAVDAEASVEAKERELTAMKDRCEELQAYVRSLEVGALEAKFGSCPPSSETLAGATLRSASSLPPASLHDAAGGKKESTSSAVAAAVAEVTDAGKNAVWPCGRSAVRGPCGVLLHGAFVLLLSIVAIMAISKGILSMIGSRPAGLSLTMTFTDASEVNNFTLATRDGPVLSRGATSRREHSEKWDLKAPGGTAKRRHQSVDQEDQDLRRPLGKDDAAEEEGSALVDDQSLQSIEKQVAQLRSGTDDDKTQAALVLGIMATTSAAKQAAIARAGAVTPLMAMLKERVPEARGQAAVALKALAANNTYNKVAIVRAGAIPVLIRLIQQDDSEVQEVAAAALQTLAETSNTVEIAQAGAIVPLVALLRDERPGVREEAAGALVILALNADNQVAIAQVGAIPLLVELLDDEVPQVREQAAAALRNLAAENLDNQVAIARAGAFAPLAELLQDHLQGVREEALAALRNLAGQMTGAENAEVAAAAAAAAGLAIRAAAGDSAHDATKSA
eukprot:TRINITY_DN24016_c0_g1_i1.p1 TRINITY_DN24016_c0_g1~~TRINITY_DN24016_c0_g1_i1.p1  ORF type:complete len:750 (-),score=187.30 TRINITY_DN24016_c0_g1_i1:111-2360(-)